MAISFFRYPIFKRQIILLLADLLIIVGSVYLSATIRLGFEEGQIYIRDNITSFILIILVFIFTFFIAELYDTRKDFSSLGNFITISVASVTASFVLMVLFYLYWPFRIGRGVFAINCILITLLVFGWRLLYSYLLDQPVFKKNVLIIGAGKAGKAILKEINALKKSGLRVVGFIDDDPAKKNISVLNVKVIGDRYTLRNVIYQNNIDQVIVAITHEKHADLIKALVHSSWNGVDIVDMPTIYEQLTGKVPFLHINDMWLLQSVMNRTRLYGKIIKPVIEIPIALMLFLLSLPVIGLIAISIKLSTTGRIFYVQERVGKDGKKFTIIKFRTMIENAESNTGAVYTADNDPRITRIGNILRKWRLDEIPQLLNVITGDMSLIGPRPERDIFIRQFEENIPFYSQRLAVRPGLTGWAQVKYPYASSFEQTEEKFQYDLYYIKNMSFLLDMIILLKTIKEVLFGKGK